jgi:hypothetical protein
MGNGTERKSWWGRVDPGFGKGKDGCGGNSHLGLNREVVRRHDVKKKIGRRHDAALVAGG